MSFNNVEKLEKASNAYYNEGEVLMTDEEFDKGKKELEKANPEHPFLKKVGAPVTQGKVKLPFSMPSLDEKKENDLKRWLLQHPAENYMIQPKLDGCSVMFSQTSDGEQHLYTRGDGREGQNIDHLLLFIEDLDEIIPDLNIVVRGELVLPQNAECIPEGKIGRNIVAGLFGQKKPDKKILKEVKFFVYEIFNDVTHPTEEIQRLADIGFVTVPYTYTSEVTRENLSAIYTDFMKNEYDLDGLVIIPNAETERFVEERASYVAPPKWKVAWKDMLDIETFETTVTEVKWNTSPQGVLVPVVHFEPVETKGAKISKATGYNAKYIDENLIGPGTIISVKRSKDVIPYIVEVLEGTEASMPLVDYEWVTEYKIRAIGESDEHNIARLKKALDELKVENVGPATVKDLYEKGFKTIKSIYDATAKDFENSLERCKEKKALQIYNGLRHGASKWTELNYMLASGTMPDGIGISKLKSMYDIEQNPENWTMELFKKNKPFGISIESIQTIIDKVDDYVQWFIDNMSGNSIFTDRLMTETSEQTPEMNSVTPDFQKGPAFPGFKDSPFSSGKISQELKIFKTYVFTGPRDKVLEKKLIEYGHKVEDNITKRVDYLVYTGELKESNKTKKAAEYGIPIIKSSEIDVF